MKRKTGHAHAGLRRRVGADTPCRSTRRKLLIALGAGALVAPFGSFAQQQGKVWRVGFLAQRSRPDSQPATLELFINRKPAKALGLTIPQSLLISADKVIE